MNRTSHVGVMVCALWAMLSVVGLHAQDPLVVSPDAYRLEFENAWVKVVRVRYAPKAVVPPHDHTERASAYVYLNDGGPILFKHEGLPYAGVTRPATKAGSFRVYKGIKEVHSVENPTDTPNEFLRVEFKTEPVDDASLRGKFFRESVTSPGVVQRTQFENAQVRVARIVMPAREPVQITAPSGQPALVVALTDARINNGGEGWSTVTSGKTAWLAAGETLAIDGGEHAAEVLRFDFKTSLLTTDP